MTLYLHELRARELEEDGVRLLGAGTSEQSLSRSGRTVQQDALGRPDADVVEHVLVSHGQHHGLDQLLDLLVQPWKPSHFICSDVAVDMLREAGRGGTVTRRNERNSITERWWWW